MNQRTITSPMKIVLELHNNILTWEGPWDSDFNTLFEAFCGLCSAGGFEDKSKLKEHLMGDLQDEFYEPTEE